MQKPVCHSNGHNPQGQHWNHCRRPDRWNCGWSKGAACQMHQRCHKESIGHNNFARDMMHNKNHANHHHHHHHPLQGFQKLNHFGHFMRHFHHHHHGHSHPHFHSHHPSHFCSDVPNHPYCPSHTNQPQTCQSSFPPTEVGLNTRSVGTETENENAAQQST